MKITNEVQAKDFADVYSEEIVDVFFDVKAFAFNGYEGLVSAVRSIAKSNGYEIEEDSVVDIVIENIKGLSPELH